MKPTLEHRLKINDELHTLKQALSDGRITEQEYRYYLEKQYGIQEFKHEETIAVPSKRPKATIVGSLLLIAAIATFMLFSQGGITGLVVFDNEQPVNLLFTENTVYQANITNTTALKVSGTLVGEATIYGQTGNDTWLVWAGDTDTLTGIWLDKESYGLGEEIGVTVLPSNTSYTLWLNKDGNKTLLSEPFTIEEPGEYVLDAIINTTNATKASTTVIVRNDTAESEAADEPSLTFGDVCEETCELPGTDIEQLIITVNGSLHINELLTTQQRENTAPRQIAQIPDIAVDGTGTIDLNAYFTDADDDEIVYELNNIIGVQEEIDEGIVTLESNIPGTYDARVYASDLASVTTSNEFTITILDETPEQNVTVSETENQTAETDTNQTTSQTVNETTDVPSCDHPNINMRPAECFGEQLDAAFEEVVAPLKNTRGAKVGRFTRYGNLIISGMVVENSADEPGNNDFSIGYTERRDFTEQRVTTAWIDTETGDLHLRGDLFEEQGGLIAPQYDSYAISNSNGIVLAYFDERTGDLHLKANIVQLGRP